jgi:DNA-binding XRE family transcriptional regulator
MCTVTALYPQLQQFTSLFFAGGTAFCYSQRMPMLPGLRKTREKRLLTQRELALKAKVSPTTVSRLESLQVDAELRTIRKLAEALGVEAEELVGD